MFHYLAFFFLFFFRLPALCDQCGLCVLNHTKKELLGSLYTSTGSSFSQKPSEITRTAAAVATLLGILFVELSAFP